MEALTQKEVRRVPPDGEVLVDSQLEKIARQPGLGIEPRFEIEARPTDVMLLRPKRDLLARIRRGKVLAPPCARELAGKPRMGELSDRKRTLVIQTNKHPASVPCSASVPAPYLRLLLAL